MASPEGGRGKVVYRDCGDVVCGREEPTKPGGYGSRPRKASSMQKTPMKLSITLTLIMWLRNIQPSIRNMTPRNV